MKTSYPLKCFLSEKGHKNFWYPTYDKVVILKGCEYEKLNWITGGPRKLCALKVSKECVVPLEYKERSVTIMSPPQKDSYIIVWTEEVPVPLSSAG